MKFIIYIATRLRQGQYPRLPDFPYSEKHGKYIYQGKELDSDEFNTACEKVFEQNYRTSGYVFRPLVIAATLAVAEPEAKPEPVVETPPAEEQPVESPEQPTATTDPFHGFFMEDNVIYLEGQRIGSLVDGILRMAKGKSELREQVEAFISSTQPQ